MNIKEIIKSLPSNWDEVTLEMFIKLLDCQVIEDEDILNGYLNVVNFTSALTGIPIEQFDNVPMTQIKELGEKLNYIVTPIPHKKNKSFKWKGMDEITMDDYIGYIQYEDKAIYHLNDFIKKFNKKQYTTEEIDKMPITEVMYGFFLYRRKLEKYFSYLIVSEQRKLAIMEIKKLARRIYNKVTFNKTEQ